MGPPKTQCAQDHFRRHGRLRHLVGLHRAVLGGGGLRRDRGKPVLKERKIMVGAASEGRRRRGREVGCARFELGDAELGRRHHGSWAVMRLPTFGMNCTLRV